MIVEYLTALLTRLTKKAVSSIRVSQLSSTRIDIYHFTLYYDAIFTHD